MLTEKEWLFLHDLTYKIHQCEALSDMQKSTLELIRYLIPFDMGTFYLASGTDAHILTSPVGINISREKLQKYIDSYEDIDYTRWIFMTSKCMVYRESDFFTDSERENLEFYKEVYVPDNIHYSIYLCLVYNGVFVGVVSLYRSKDKPDFSDRDVHILDLLKEHLALRVFRKNLMSEQPYLTPRSQIDLRTYAEKYHLTMRETEVFYLLFDEITDEKICEKLFISQSTFKKHLLNIYKKAEVRNRLQLLKLIK